MEWNEIKRINQNSQLTLRIIVPMGVYSPTFSIKVREDVGISCQSAGILRPV